jgi:hypothetical protein
MADLEDFEEALDGTMNGRYRLTMTLIEGAGCRRARLLAIGARLS